MILSTLMRFPVPDGPMHHNIMLPPPCLTVDITVVFFGLYACPFFLQTPSLWPKRSRFISSDQMMCFQHAKAFSRLSLACFSLRASRN